MIYRFLFAAACEIEASSLEEARLMYADANLMGSDATWEYDLEHQLLDEDDEE